AGLQRLRYLLLLWGADRNGTMPLPPDEVHRVANERLMQMMPQVLPTPSEMGPQQPAPAVGITPPGTTAVAPTTPAAPANNSAAPAVSPSATSLPARTQGGR
ncbi:MAG: rod shape-determining protein MreC, partial [Hafnia sp.]